MDIVDSAQALIEQQNEISLAARRTVAPVANVAAEECAECGDAIAAGRKQLIPGTQHCADCAGLVERGLI